MYLLVSNGQKYRNVYGVCIGGFASPRSWGKTKLAEVWAADNDCFQGFNRLAYLKMLAGISVYTPKPKFVTIPDVVGSYADTLDLFVEWHRPLADLGLPKAFVLQDGAERCGVRGIPWDQIEALFIGGTTGFKLGKFAAEMVKEAKNRGKWAHMGRVNGRRRLDYAIDIGCDSCDGSSMSKWKDAILPGMVDRLRQTRFAL